eukprot:1377103-Amorphochlora_amoeboformis.AAC.1
MQFDIPWTKWNQTGSVGQGGYPLPRGARVGTVSQGDAGIGHVCHMRYIHNNRQYLSPIAKLTPRTPPLQNSIYARREEHAGDGEA